jgi:Rrf2 family protein
MRISTRSRYGIRLMINLAENYGKGNLFLKDIAKDEEISEKYLSQIVIPLRRAGLLVGNRGVHGGYMLAKNPSKISLKDIIEVLEGDLYLIECSNDIKVCKRSNLCVSKDVWMDLSLKIVEFLKSITLAGLVKNKNKKCRQLIEYEI